MRWRKDQSQAIDTSRSLGSNTSEMSGYRHTAEILTERKYLSSIYVLCRVLTAVVESATRETLGDDVGSTLEDIIYNSLKNADPSVLTEFS